MKSVIVGMLSPALVTGVSTSAEAATKTWTTSTHQKVSGCKLLVCWNYTKSVTFYAKANAEMKTIKTTGKVYAGKKLLYSRTRTATSTSEHIWKWTIPKKYRNVQLKVVVSATFKKRLYSAYRTSTKYFVEPISASAPQ